MENEQWKDIEELDCDYQISSIGRVKSKERWQEFPYLTTIRRRRVRERIMKSAVKKTGKRVDSVQIAIRGINFVVSRLVYKYFVGDIPNDLCVAHKNKIPTDNRVENLVLVTWSESRIIDHKKSGLTKKWQKERSKRGANAMKRKAFLKKLLFYSPSGDTYKLSAW